MSENVMTENDTKTPKNPPMGKKARRMHPNSLKNLQPPFDSTSEWSKKCREKASLNKHQIAELRRNIRDGFAQAAPADLKEKFWRAAQSGNRDVCECIKMGLQIFGGTFDQSEERVNNLKVKADVSGKTDNTLNVKIENVK